MICPKCGMNLPDDAGFCPMCGTNMQTVQKSVAENPIQYDPMTGQPVQPVAEAPVQFDPMTGQPVQPVAEAPVQFDPMTGQPVQPVAQAPVRFDPMTGQPVQPVPTPAKPGKAPKAAKAPKAPKTPKAPKAGKASRGVKPGVLIGAGVGAAAVIGGAVVFFNSNAWTALAGTPDQKLALNLELGAKYLEKMKYDKALAAFDKAIAIDPNNIEANLGMAGAYVGLNQYDNAEGQLESLLTALEERGYKKTHEEVYATLATYYYDDGKLDNAAATIGRCVVNIDSDGDGVPDYYERILGLDPDSYDSDGDGISDGAYVMDMHMTEDMMDYTNIWYADADGDGLNNSDELYYRTNPFNPDSDLDGLTDYEEIFYYYTNANEPDTDGDGLFDGTEVRAGLDPLNTDSDGDGKSDGELVFERVVPMPSVGETGTAYPVLWVEGKGECYGSFDAASLKYNNTLTSIGSVVGYPYEIAGSCNMQKARLGFAVDSAYMKYMDPSDLLVAGYDYTSNKLVFLPTDYYYDDEGTVICTTDTITNGTYMLVNYKRFMYDVSVGTEESVLDSGKADMVFVLDSTGSMSSPIRNVRENIAAFADYLSTIGVDIRIGLVEYKDIYEDGTDSTIGYGFYYDPEEFSNVVYGIRVTGGGDGPETSVDALQEMMYSSFRAGVSRFAILITDADNKDGTRTNAGYTLYDIAYDLQKAGIITSVVTDTDYYSEYSVVTDATGGLLCDIYSSSFYEELILLMNKIGTIVGEGTWVRLTNGSVVCLDADPSYGDRSVDTDGDGICDIDELGEKIRVSYTDPYGNSVSFDAYTFKSNPVLADSDGDGYADLADINPIRSDVVAFNIRSSEDYLVVDAYGDSAYGISRTDSYGNTFDSGLVALENMLFYLQMNGGDTYLTEADGYSGYITASDISNLSSTLIYDYGMTPEDIDISAYFEDAGKCRKIMEKIAEKTGNADDGYISVERMGMLLAQYTFRNSGREMTPFIMSMGAFSEEEIVDQLGKSLEGNHPVMLQAGMTTGVTLYADESLTSAGTTAGSYEWMVITAYKHDEISGKTTLTVVYDGGIYYIDYTAFMKQGGFMGSIVGVL